MVTIKNINDLTPEQKDSLLKDVNELINVASNLFGIKNNDFLKITNDNDLNSFIQMLFNDNLDNKKEDKSDNSSWSEIFETVCKSILDELDVKDNSENTDDSENSNDIKEQEDIWDNYSYQSKDSDNAVCKCQNNNTNYALGKYNDELYNNIKNIQSSLIKNRLIEEANFDAEKYNEELKNDLIDKVHEILIDEKAHKYKIYKKTATSPAAAEIQIQNVPVYLKDNMFILKDVETCIKNIYEFNNVYINILPTTNDKFIDLNIYMTF
jgi:hypothetical protein